MQSELTPPTVSEIRQLPADLTMLIPPEWEDRNGHVNVQYYLTLYERGGWNMLGNIGASEQHQQQSSSGIFDLEHHIKYLSEIKVGDTVSVHNRMLSYTDKLFQGMFFIVNDTQENLAATVEYLSVHIHMKQRRSAPFSMSIAAKLRELSRQHEAMNWTPPVSGLMNLKMQRKS
jgi:acyl-CoA thioesterase FadM